MFNDFPGITSVFPHIMVIFFLWLMVYVIVKVIRKRAVHNSEDINKSTEEINKAASVVINTATALALIFVVIVVLFLSSPFQRNYEDMNRVPDAEIDKEFVAPTVKEIVIGNEQSVSRKAEVNKNQATADNTQAMKGALKLFKNAANQADKQ